MKHRMFGFVAVLVFAATGGMLAQAPAPVTTAPALPQAWEHPTGAYKVAMEEDASLPGHTVYRPADLSPFHSGNLLPIVAFSGPGCDADGTAFRPFFTEVASHGYLLVVNGLPEPKGATGPGSPKTKTSDLLAAVDWAVAESSRPAGKYYHKADPTRIAVMGQSCGGLQTLELSSDPRFTTIVLWNSGVFNTPLNVPNMPTNLGKDKLKFIKVPMAYFVGKTDMASPNAQDDFARIDHLPVFLGILDIPGDAHAGTFRQNNGGKFAQAGVAWLDWRLKGNASAARAFQGTDCTLCRDPQWQVRKKKID